MCVQGGATAFYNVVVFWAHVNGVAFGYGLLIVSITRLLEPPPLAAGLSAFASSAASTHSQKMSMGSVKADVVVSQSTLHCEHRTFPIFAFLLLHNTRIYDVNTMRSTNQTFKGSSRTMMNHQW